MNSFLIQFIEISVSVGLIGLVLVLVSSPLNKRFSLYWKRWAWLLFALRLVFPFSISLPQAPVRVDISGIENIAGTARAVNQTGFSIPAGQMGGYTEQAAAIDWHQIIIFLWLAVTVGIFLYSLVSHIVFRRRVLRWSLPAGEDTKKTGIQISRQLKLKSVPGLRVSKQITSPMLIGVFRPVILLPYTDYRQKELELILCHEMVHYKRKDTWLKLLLQTAKSLHWFNPAVRLMAKQAERDIELACDEMVILLAGTGSRRSYGSLILESAAAPGQKPAVMTTGFLPDKKLLQERIINIMQKNKKKGGMALLLVLITVTLLSGLMLTFASGNESAGNDQVQSESNYAKTEYAPLLALKPAGYDKMTVAQFRESVFTEIEKNEEEVRELMDKEDEQLIALRYTDDNASFICNILIPLTADHYPQYYYAAGWMDQPHDFEVELTAVVSDENNLTVGQYETAVRGIFSEASDLISQADAARLIDETALQQELEEIKNKYQSNGLELELSGLYVQFEADPPVEDTSEAYSPASQADYDMMLGLRLPDYEKMTVAEYKDKIIEAFSQEETGINEAWERVYMDMLVNETGIELSEEELYFLHITLQSTILDYEEEQRNQYRSKPQLPFYYFEYFNNEEKDYEFIVKYDVRFKLLTPDTLLVSERDQKIADFLTAINTYLQSRTKNQAKEGREDCKTYFKEQAARHTDSTIFFETVLDEYYYTSSETLLNGDYNN